MNATNNLIKGALRSALLTAYPRSLSGIPYSHEMFRAAIELATEFDLKVPNELFVCDLELEIAGRFWAVESIIQKYHPSLVIDIGSGLSPRGLIQKADYGRDVVEIDLPSMIRLKQKVLDIISIPDSKRPATLSADASHETEITKALENTPGSTFSCVVCEGLMWYLDWTAREILAVAIREYLSTTRGVWITSDCPPIRNEHTNSDVTSWRQVIPRSAGVDDSRKFANPEHFAQFFSQLGFDVEIIPLSDMIPRGILSRYEDDKIRYRQILQRLDSYASIAVLKS